MVVNRTAQAQVPIALFAHTQALSSAADAETDHVADEENVADNDQARVTEQNRQELSRLLGVCNSRRDELVAHESRAMETLTDLLRIQAKITAAVNYRPPAPRAPPAPTSHQSDKRDDRKDKEHRAMIDILLGLSKSNSNANPESIALLGQPQAPQVKPRPSTTEIQDFLVTNNLIPPQDVHAAVKMASSGNYSYLVMNHLTGLVEVRIFTPWHELNAIISLAFI
jgi:hypothetical protein